MEERHGIVWVPLQRCSYTTLKDLGFNVFHSGVTAHVVNLSQNLLTCVTVILYAPKFLTELRLGSNSFNGKFPSKILKLDHLKKIYFLHNTRISGNFPSDIINVTGLIDMEMSFTSLHGNISSKFGLIEDLHYLGMDKTHIRGPIPTDMEYV